MNEKNVNQGAVEQIVDELTKQKGIFNEHSINQNISKEKIHANVKIFNYSMIIIVILTFIVPLLTTGVDLHNILKIARNAMIIFSSSVAIDILTTSIDFKISNKLATQSSKMIDILIKKLDYEKQISLEKENKKKHLVNIKQFLSLAKQYSQSSDRYISLFHNDLENKYFVSESEESMIVQDFILDDLKRERELEEEIKDEKVLSKRLK